MMNSEGLRRFPGSLDGGAASTGDLKRSDASDETRVDTSIPLADYLDRCERAYLTQVLEERRGRVLETARVAGINRRTLLRKMNKHQLDKSDYR